MRASLHFISCSPAALGTFYLVTYCGVSSPSLDWVLRVDSTSGPCMFPKLQGFSKGGPGTPLSRDLKSLLKMQMTTESESWEAGPGICVLTSSPADCDSHFT